MKTQACLLLSTALLLSTTVANAEKPQAATYNPEALRANTAGKGFGPQSPRDIDAKSGTNPIVFSAAPAYTSMNLCNIHFHKNAEHKGGEFTSYSEKDGSRGYVYNGKLSKKELKPAKGGICAKDGHGELKAGDTIEVHYVHSSADITPGPTLGACLHDSIKNPQLRVEAQVYVLVNDKKALDFAKLTQIGKSNGKHQALNIPTNTGTPVQYAGSTTGPSYDEQGSPFQVSWSVRPQVAKVNIESVGSWCKDNAFKEDHAHGVRRLVVEPELLSEIK